MVPAPRDAAAHLGSALGLLVAAHLMHCKLQATQVLSTLISLDCELAHLSTELQLYITEAQPPTASMPRALLAVLLLLAPGAS